MVLLIYFILLYFLFGKFKSIFNFFIIIQILSLLTSLYLKTNIELDTLRKIFNIVYIAMLYSIIFYPWLSYKNISSISIYNRSRFNNLVKAMGIISTLTLVVLVISSITVFLLVPNINTFKYSPGESTEFFYNFLPFHVRWYILGTMFYILGYFYIPLHFYYFQQGKTRYGIYSLVLSLNVIFFGLTFFSRWTITHYVLIYLSFLFLFRKSLPKKYYAIFKIIALIGVILFLYLFIDITLDRFTQDTSYESNIPVESPIQNPSLFSTMDYVSQWYSNSLIILDNYRGQTTMGQTSLSPLLSLINHFTPFNWDADNYTNLRKRLIGDKYWYMFTGLAANWIFDFGYIMSFIIALLYNKLVKSIKPKNGVIKMDHLLLISLLIQIPLVSIFYSFLGGIILSLILWLPMHYYLKYRVRII